MAGMGLGRVKTQTCFWKVEFPSRNRSPDSWRHSRHSSRGRDRENNSQQLLPRHVFTQPGSISTIDDVRWVSGAPSIAPNWRTTASRRRSAANGGDKVAGPTTETSGRLTVETALPLPGAIYCRAESSVKCTTSFRSMVGKCREVNLLWSMEAEFFTWSGVEPFGDGMELGVRMN